MNTERAQVGWGFWLWWVLASIVGLAVGNAVSVAVSGAVEETVGLAVSLAVSGAVAGASIGTAQWLVLRRQVSQTVWWVLASTVGLAVGNAVALAVFEAVGLTGGSHFSGGAVAFVLFGAVAGASVGIAQWLVLRRHIPGAGWWVLASTVGLPVGFAVGFAVLEAVGLTGGSHFSGGAGSLVLFGAVAGASVGIAQWLVLRRYIPGAGWWVLASIVGSAAAFAVIFTVTAGVEETVGYAGGGAVGGALYGAITGAALVWLLRQPITQEPSPPPDAG